MKRLLIAAFATAALMAMIQPAAACSYSGCPLKPDEGVAGETGREGADAVKLSKDGKIRLESADVTKLSKGGKAHLDTARLLDLGEAGLPGPETGLRNEPGQSGDGRTIAAD